MDPVVIVVLVAAASLVVLGAGLVSLGRARRRRRARRKSTSVADVVAIAQDAVRAGREVGRRARELAPAWKGSIQSIMSFVDSVRPSLRSELADDGTITLLFSDIEDSTAVNARLGDEGWMEEIRAHAKLVQSLVDANAGRVVKSQGDGFMVAFREPADAVRCGVALQRALAEAPSGQEPLRVRVGIHTGTAISEDGDYFGENVAFAARVAQQADGGEILVSTAVRDRGADGVVFSGGEEVELKGIAGQHRLYRVDWSAST
ncbi:MAG: adenylate/guanylate cyclase domain-containing protein [Acidimicrobiales bacterium]